jgi:hypothetical protein
MKKRINLMLRRQGLEKVQSFFKLFRVGIFLYSLVISLFLTSYFIINSQMDRQINTLETDKRYFLAQIKSKSKNEADLIHSAKKAALVDQYLAEDIKFFPYYKLIVDSMEKSGAEVTLHELSLGKNYETTFALSFRDFENLLNFLRFAETDEFLGKFRTLSLSRVSNSSTDQNFELFFQGEFKLIK